MKVWGWNTGALRGKRIAILAADGFEYVELSVPKLALKLSGANVEVLSLTQGRIRGMNLTEPTRTVRVQRSVSEVDVDDYDGLYIPGGFVGPDFLRQSQDARHLVRSFDARGKAIATMCHGPWLLVSAGLVADRKLAAWPGIRDDVVNAGGIWRDRAVVRDGNWLSSRGPQDLAAFVPALVAFFAGDAEHSAWIEQDEAMRSSSASSDPPAVAVAAARLLPGPSLLTLASAMLGTGAAGVLTRSWPWHLRQSS